MTPLNLNHVTLYCSHLLNSVSFYNKQLGIEILQLNQHQGYALLNCGSCRLVLMQSKDNRSGVPVQQVMNYEGKQRMCTDSKADSAREDNVVLSLNCQDAEAFYHNLKAKGLQFIDQPCQQFWGGIRVSLRDPDGHLLYLVSSG